MLTANYLPAGCVFYFQGQLKPHMDAREIDATLIARYEIAISKDARYWRKSQGVGRRPSAPLPALYLLLASRRDWHSFFEHEVNIKDARTSPIHFRGYDRERPGRALLRGLALRTKRESL